LRDNKRQAHLRFSPHGIRPSERFTGGSHLPRVPNSLSDPESLPRKILFLLAHLQETTGQAYTPKELAKLFFEKHDTSHNLAPRLSELATLGLVERIPIDNKTGKWSLKAGIDVTNTDKLVALCQSNLGRLKEPKVSRLPMHGDLLRRISEVDKTRL